MDTNQGYFDQPRWQQPPVSALPAGPPSDRTLQHRISDVSDINDHDYHAVRPQESMVSLATEYNSNPSTRQPYSSDANNNQSYAGSGGWNVSFMGDFSSHGYEPISVSGATANTSYMSTSTSSMSRKKSRAAAFGRHNPYETIPEDESIDLSLLSQAAPMGYGNNYSSIPEDDVADSVNPGFDLSTFDSGPPMGSGYTSSAQLKELQEQEASGKLTGGIGMGWRAEATVRGEDLLAMSPIAEHSSGGPFTRGLNRAATIKNLGQNEANRSGKVVEVVMDDDIGTLPAAAPSDVDLSAIVGPSTLNNPGNRASTFTTIKRQKTEIFYPQPNWKPFSMRWPYLIFLILLSIGLAIGQEMAYQKSPILSFDPGAGNDDPLIFFIVKFVPTIITVMYGVLWQFTDFEVKRLEAFYQLSKPGGALAAESINVDYITAFSIFRPFGALKLKHYAVAVSSVATVLAVSLVPTLGAASISISQSKDVKVDRIFSRLLSSVLCLCAVLACILFWLLHRRKTGLNNDVKGIAGLASMAVVAHILTDFKDLDVAPPKDIHARLKYHRYVLRNSSLAPDDNNPASRQDQEKYEKTYLSDNPHPLMLRASGAIPFIFAIFVFLGLIPVFIFIANIARDNPWALTLMAVGIKLSWGSMETDVRMMEPYYILYKRHAPPKTLCLDYTALPFGWMPIRALLNGHILVFFVGLGSVFAELVTILVTSLATVDGPKLVKMLRNMINDDNSDKQQVKTVTSFFISLAMTAFILVYMGIVASTVYIRRRHPFLPRLPNTIASILAFIHQSKMLYDFVGTEKLNNAQMIRRLEKIGKRYGLGWFEGRDGQTHCGVDQEELSGSYKHGMDYEAVNKPWVGNWDRYDE